MSLNYVAASVHYGSSRQQGTEEGLGEVVREACGHAAAAADACKQLTRKQQQQQSIKQQQQQAGVGANSSESAFKSHSKLSSQRTYSTVQQ
jgi:hypothetical protein